MYENLKEFLTDDFWIMPATPKYIDNGIPYITSKNIKNGKIDYSNINYISKEDYENISKNRPIKVNDILISMIGTIGETAVVSESDGEFYGQNMFLVRLNENKINQRFFLNYFKSSFVKNQLFSKQNKSTQSYLKANHIEDLKVPVISIQEQIKISEKLDKIQIMIDEKKEQINLLNQLIKSQFVEMFGNPLLNIDNSISMTEVCEIIDGDRGSNYPKQSDFYDDEYCLFLNAKNVTDHGFDFSNNMYITKEKDEQLRKGKLKRGDVILTTRGTVGNLAFYDKDVIYENIRINSGMVILRMDKEKINERFFIEQFRFQLDNIKFKIANGSAQPQLPISKMSAIKLLLPDIEFQNKFAQIAEQIDKQKFEFENSLNKLEELQASLMQEYFG